MKISSHKIPYAWLAIAAVFLIRAPHPAASGSVDPDVYWHLLYGHWIIDHMALPTVDMWSWTLPGKSYNLTQWLGEVVIALAERLGGEAGKQALAASLTVLAITCSYRAARCYLSNSTAAIVVALFGCSVLVSMTCRPHLFTYAGLTALTWIFAEYGTKGNQRALYFVPAITALWVNLHGGYALGLFYLWLVAGAHIVSAVCSNNVLQMRRTLAALVLTAIAGSLATAINPYGIGVWENTAAVGALKSVSLGITGEWVPTNIRDDLGFSYLTIVMATVMAMSFSERRPSTRDASLFVTIFVVGCWASRLSIMASVLLVPLIAKFLGNTPFYRLAFSDREKTEGRIQVPAAISILLAIGALGYLVGSADKSIEQRVHRDFPVEEVAFLKEHNLKGPIMNTMEAGGYLIRHLQQPVFLDTRLDLYGDDYFFDFMRAAAGGDHWAEFMKKWDPEIVMIEHSMPLKNLLLQAGTYTTIFVGPRYTVLQKAQPASSHSL